MAKNTSSAKKIISAPKKTSVSTPVRNTAIPKTRPVAAARKAVELTTDMISMRAYEIHLSGRGGSEQDNWFAAERELLSKTA